MPDERRPRSTAASSSPCSAPPVAARWRCRGCSTSRVEKLVPYLVQSEDQVPGVATWYASTCTECSTGCGVHVRTREGRAVKLEGNPEHPVNQGKLCSRGQAALQGLYNPGRIKAPMAREAGRHASARSPGTTRSRGWRRSSARPERQGRRHLAARAPGRFSDLLAEWTTALGGRLVRYEPFDHEPHARGEPPRVRAGPAARARLRQRASTSSRSAPTSSRPGLARSRTSAASPGRTGSPGGDVAKFVYAGAAAWISPASTPTSGCAIVPGTETALALAMANVLVAASGAAPAGLSAALAAYTPATAAQETGVPAERIERIAREFAAAKPEPRGGRRRRRRSTPARPSCAPRSTCSTTSPATSARRCASAPTSAAADGYAALGRAGHGDGRRAGRGAAGARRQPGLHAAQATGFAGQAQEGRRSRSRPRCSSTRPPRSATCCCRSTTRSSAGTTSRPRAGVRGLMQPVMEPVFNTLRRRRHPAPGGQEGGRRAGASSPRRRWEAHLQARWQALAARAEGRQRRRASGAPRCSAAASSARRHPRPPCRSRRRTELALHQAGVRGRTASFVLR